MADPSVMFSQPNAGAMFAKGFQQAQEAKKQNMAKAAYAELARNPSNAKAFEMLLQVAPEAAMQFREQALDHARQQTKDFQGTIQQAAEMIRRVKHDNPEMPDEQVYGMVRSSLIGMGAPGADRSPAQFDPQYYAGIMALADPVKEPQGQMISFVPGGGVARYNPQTGQVETVVMPNPGDQPTGSPVGGGVQEGATATNPQTGEKIIFRGGQWQPIGGPTQPASGGFPGR